jgi:hypothetical protein
VRRDVAPDACPGGCSGERVRQHMLVEWRIATAIREQPTAIVMGQS